MAEPSVEPNAADPAGGQTATVEVQEAEVPDVPAGHVEAVGGQIGILLDTKMEIAVSLGATEILVRDLLSLGCGSVLQLDRKVGQPVDLYLRVVRFATGDLVVVGEQLGVRVKEILETAPSPPPDEA